MAWHQAADKLTLADRLRLAGISLPLSRTVVECPGLHTLTCSDTWDIKHGQQEHQATKLVAPLQAQLGLRRSKQCEDLLGLASWLAFNQPAKTTHTMRSQLSRLYGQLYAVMGK